MQCSITINFPHQVDNAHLIQLGTVHRGRWQLAILYWLYLHGSTCTLYLYWLYLHGTTYTVYLTYLYLYFLYLHASTRTLYWYYLQLSWVYLHGSTLALYLNYIYLNGSTCTLYVYYLCLYCLYLHGYTCTMNLYYLYLYCLYLLGYTYTLYLYCLYLYANPLPTRTLTRSKVPERATLSAPCGALSPWPSAIGLHGETTTLVTEWWWRYCLELHCLYLYCYQDHP